MSFGKKKNKNRNQDDDYDKKKRIRQHDFSCCNFWRNWITICHYGNKYIKLGKRNNKYINLITSGELNLDNIAHVIGVPYETVVKDLKEMIEDGYFKGAYVNDYSRQLVMPYSKNTINSYDSDSIVAAPKITNKIVKCPNCGATNTIIVGGKN